MAQSGLCMKHVFAFFMAVALGAQAENWPQLRGPAGAGLCRAMRAALLRCAADVYGVPATKLRVFFHYQPQFYRLHAHCTRAEHTNPGCECDRAHLLTTVAANLDLSTGIQGEFDIQAQNETRRSQG